MASNRKLSRSSRTGLTLDLSEPPPPIAALFLIHFDIKAGYVSTASWQFIWESLVLTVRTRTQVYNYVEALFPRWQVPSRRQVDTAILLTIYTVELENVVEYKSLPSGLHNVREDLVYFIHEEYAGVSAFLNQPAAESERNALMLAAGVLVPLCHGRLGKNWRHAIGLKELVRKLAYNQDDTRPLSDYWEQFKLPDHESQSPPDSPLDQASSHPSKQNPQQEFRRSRALSDATALTSPNHTLASFHPALSSPELIEDFGPLIFPLYRAALLRKRILFMADAPIETACNSVYNLSLLSSIPHSLIPHLPPKTHAILRSRPLFNVGIHDMPYLSSLPHDSTTGQSCWIACTSDRVLGMKHDLYDVLAELPPPYSKAAVEKVYPTVTFPNPTQKDAKQTTPMPVKATQRDVRRYLHLKSGLAEFSRTDSTSAAVEDDSDASSTFSSASIVEPLSWSLLAYTSFIWWASAGEKRSEYFDEESEQDARLLLTDEDGYLMQPNSASRRSSSTWQEGGSQPREIALITYFRRLTTQIFSVLSDIICRHDGVDIDETNTGLNTSFTSEHDGYERDEEDSTLLHSTSTVDEPNEPLLPEASSQDDNYEDDEPVPISTSDVANMGLDPWSDTDRAFVETLCAVWFRRKVDVQSARVRCCGVQIL